MKLAGLYIALGVSVLLHLSGLVAVAGMPHASDIGRPISGTLRASLSDRRPANKPDLPSMPEPIARHSTLPRGQPPVSQGQVAGPQEQVPPYWPADMLEQVPVPVSAPDVSRLGTEVFPADSVHLRLFINASGRVDDVQVLDEQSADGWAPICRMFLATTFIPARRAGQRVASVLDLEISISDLIRML